MINIGIIGAGAISEFHINAYKKNPQVKILMICDVNEETAKKQAEEFGIPEYVSDYRKILENEKIDAVSIVTPTFTHKSLVIDSLTAGKHVLCEKPPALNYEEAVECEKKAKETGKILMYGFVVRFSKEITYLKECVDSGKMGEIYYAEASRLIRCNRINGWFIEKEKSGGGALIDGAIHEIDSALYLMGYPEVKSVRGFSTRINETLPETVKGAGNSWVSKDVKSYKRNVESFASGYINFKNGACLYVKASWVLNTVNEGRKIELIGTNSGAYFNGENIKMISVEKDGYYTEVSPVLRDEVDIFDGEINHFVNCCEGKEELICTPKQGSEIMKIITAIYESAETGKEIVF